MDLGAEIIFFDDEVPVKFIKKRNWWKMSIM
jgi:hypothetical protein